MLKINQSQTLILKAFFNQSAVIIPKGEICLTHPSSANAHKVRERTSNENNIKGLLIKLTPANQYYVGTPDGRYNISAHRNLGIIISGAKDLRILSSKFMLREESESLNQNLFYQFNALCLAYLSGETTQTMRQRPDAILPNANPKQRTQAFALIEHVGFYEGLKAVRKIVLS